MRDAKALFLVDDDKTQFLELGLFRQDRMRSNDDIDLAAFEPLARLFALAYQPRQPRP